MAPKLPRPDTRRRALYDLLIANAGEWVEFDAASLGYASPRGVHHDLTHLRESQEMDIRTDATGLNRCRWRYLP